MLIWQDRKHVGQTYTEGAIGIRRETTWFASMNMNDFFLNETNYKYS